MVVETAPFHSLTLLPNVRLCDPNKQTNTISPFLVHASTISTINNNFFSKAETNPNQYYFCNRFCINQRDYWSKSMGEEGEQVKGPNPNSKDHDNQTNLQLLNEKSASRKGKSCKGCLYYSSTLKSNSRNPVCVGITRSLPKVPRYYVGESEMEASKEGRSLADFRYGCVGYSVYPDYKNHTGHVQDTQKELPACVGIEVLVDRKVNNSNSAPTHAHNKDNHAIPQPRVNRPPQSASDDFFSRFTRNANIVASGVAKNVRKVGNQIKESVDDIFYPYRRRPK